MTVNTDVLLEERVKISSLVKEPCLYKVIFINDDVTPMDYVVAVMIQIFNLGSAEAVELTIKIHEEGSAVVVVLPYEIAETKVAEARVLNKQHQQILKIKVEPDT